MKLFVFCNLTMKNVFNVVNTGVPTVNKLFFIKTCLVYKYPIPNDINCNHSFILKRMLSL